MKTHSPVSIDMAASCHPLPTRRCTRRAARRRPLFMLAAAAALCGCDLVRDLTHDSNADVPASAGTAGQQIFQHGPLLQLGRSLKSTQVADMNGDGRDDVLLLDGDDRLIVLLSTGSGRFESPHYIDLPDVTARMAVGDADGDGDADVVMAGERGCTCC